MNPTPEPPPADQSIRDKLRNLQMHWLSGDGLLSHIAISSRVRVARNLQGFRFPPAAAAEESRKIQHVLMQAIEQPFFADFLRLDLGAIQPLERHMLVEQHLASPLLVSLAEQGLPGRSILVSPHGTLVAMINEEDHLRMQCLQSGLDVESGWDALSRMDDAIESQVDYAFSDQLGYITACPSNVGTAMRVSVMLHLPALALQGVLEQIKARIAGQVGLAVRGLYGEGTMAQGNLLQISNQITLGPTEEDIIGKVKGIAVQIVEQENNARQKLRREFSALLGDKVWRALGILRHAQVLRVDEALEFLSMVRLGVDLAILPPVPIVKLNQLLVSIRPATMQVLMGEATDPIKADMMRARRIREELSEEA